MAAIDPESGELVHRINELIRLEALLCVANWHEVGHDHSCNLILDIDPI